MPSYRFLTADLRTNAILAELPLTGVSFDSRLNAVGSFSGQLTLGSRAVASLDPLGSTETGRTAIYVERDGVLLWGGVLWTRRWTSDQKALQLGASDFTSYYLHRFIRKRLSFAATDQATIVDAILDHLAARPGGDIGISFTPPATGRLRDRTYEVWDVKRAYEAIADLSRVEDGFDFAVDVQYGSDGAPEKVFRLGYPRRGRVASQTGWMFDYPGNISDYSWDEDSTRQADSVYAVGSGAGPNQITATAADTDLLATGFPLLEEAAPYTDVSEQSTLNAHVRADLKALARPVEIGELHVRADLDPVLGSYITGDDTRVRILDERFNSGIGERGPVGPGLDTYVRIISIAVRPPGEEPLEDVVLTVGAA